MEDRLVYICHPYIDNPEKNIKRVQEICKIIIEDNKTNLHWQNIPIAPQLFLHQYFQGKETPLLRKKVMEHCIILLNICSICWVFRSKEKYTSDGQVQEIEHLNQFKNDILLRFADQLEMFKDLDEIVG